MMTYGFDIDGVISQAPLKIISWLFAHSRLFRGVAFKIFDLDPVWIFFHKYRKANYKILKVIREIKKENRRNRIVIISANPTRYKQALEIWFKKNNIPYDKMILRPSPSPTVLAWKKMMIEQEKCDYYLEDTTEIVLYLRKHLTHTRIIHYRNQTAKKTLKIIFGQPRV